MKHLGLFLRGLLAVLAAVVIAACSGAGGGGGTSGTTPGVSDITTATTWQAGQVYTVNGSLSVSAKLTIEPGAVIKFEPYSNYGSLLTVTSTGQIDAQGTPVNPIVFTSTKGSPAAGDWGGIIVDGNSSIFTYCTFSYGGNGAGAVLTITGPGTSVTHCTFTSNVIALDASAAGLGTTVSANEFYANATGSSTVFPLWIDKNVALDDQNVFVRADLTGPNVPQGIQIYGTISSDLTLQSTRAPYVIDGVPVVSAKLTINPGVTVKFMKYSNYGAGLTVTGQIAASGTPALPIKFTSVNDGSSVTPALGDWGGIELQATGSVFDNCHFLYSGNGNDGSSAGSSGVLFLDADTTITNCVFGYNWTCIITTATGTPVGGTLTDDFTTIGHNVNAVF